MNTFCYIIPFYARNFYRRENKNCDHCKYTVNCRHTDYYRAVSNSFILLNRFIWFLEGYFTLCYQCRHGILYIRPTEIMTRVVVTRPLFVNYDS